MCASGRQLASLRAQLERAVPLGVCAYSYAKCNCLYLVCVPGCVGVRPAFSYLPNFCLLGQGRNHLIVFLSLIFCAILFVGCAWIMHELHSRCQYGLVRYTRVTVCVAVWAWEGIRSTVCVFAWLYQSILHTLYLKNSYGFKGYVHVNAVRLQELSQSNAC